MVEGETFPRVEANFTELKNVKVVFCEPIFMYIPRTSVIRSQVTTTTDCFSFPFKTFSTENSLQLHRLRYVHILFSILFTHRKQNLFIHQDLRSPQTYQQD